MLETAGLGTHHQAGRLGMEGFLEKVTVHGASTGE